MASSSPAGLRLSFLGAAKSVTGSRFLLESADAHLMVDCGLSQERDMQSKNWEPFSLGARAHRRRPSHPCASRSLRPAAPAGQGRFPREDPCHRPHRGDRAHRHARFRPAAGGGRGAEEEAPPGGEAFQPASAGAPVHGKGRRGRGRALSCREVRRAGRSEGRPGSRVLRSRTHPRLSLHQGEGRPGQRRAHRSVLG